MTIEVQERERSPTHPRFQAMVLCGGRGTRLAAVLPDCPKTLAPVDGEPFLWRLLDQLAAAGCERVVLCTGYLGDQIVRACGDNHADMPILYSREPRALGTGGALGNALHSITSDQVLVLNGDSFVDVDLAAFVAQARANSTKRSIVANRVADTSRYGRLTIAENGDVTGFEEKAAEVGAGPINAGIYWLDRATLAGLPQERACSLEREVLPRLAADGVLAAWVTSAAFLDIGVPADLDRASEFFAELANLHARDRRGLLVVDRDGTLIEERHYLSDPAGVELLPGVVEGLRQFRAAGYELAIVTNQSGVGRGYFDEDVAATVNTEVVRQLAAHDIDVQGVYMCPHHPDAGCDCRKPRPGLFTTAIEELGYGPEQCLVVGDKRCDIELGNRLGARTALVRTGYGVATERDGMCAPDLVVNGFDELAAAEMRP
ncbi:MAG: HAD-IIIA family hydrolase [bacterium]|nr:HAD-IIIA family hydrolase [bacterium]